MSNLVMLAVSIEDDLNAGKGVLAGLSGGGWAGDLFPGVGSVYLSSDYDYFREHDSKWEREGYDNRMTDHYSVEDAPFVYVLSAYHRLCWIAHEIVEEMGRLRHSEFSVSGTYIVLMNALKTLSKDPVSCQSACAVLRTFRDDFPEGSPTLYVNPYRRGNEIHITTQMNDALAQVHNGDVFYNGGMF